MQNPFKYCSLIHLHEVEFKAKAIGFHFNTRLKSHSSPNNSFGSIKKATFSPAALKVGLHILRKYNGYQSYYQTLRQF